MNENHKVAVIEEIQKQNIKRVLIVDDAFNAPVFDASVGDRLYNFLVREDFYEFIDIKKFPKMSRKKAIADLETDKSIETDSVKNIYDICITIHNLSVTKLPIIGDYLETTKTSIPSDLGDLLEFLNQCGNDMDVFPIGSNRFSINIVADFAPQLVFLDYYLWPEKEKLSTNDNDYQNETLNNSIKLILDVNENSNPILVIMSSEDIEDKIEIYYDELSNKIMAARVGVIEKKWIKDDNGELVVTPQASEVLLDSFFGFNFSNLLDSSLNVWYKGANCALNKLKDDLYNLHTNDFAYLIKYRLNKEGEVLSDYLEWFLGEALITMIDNKVNWKDNSFVELDKLDFEEKDVDFKKYISDQRNPRSNVNTIAELYRNVRVSDIDNHRRKRFNLGDLFFSEIKNEIRMIFTPDCDIITRGDKNERNAKRLFTVGGKIVAIHDKEASAKELVFVKSLNKFKSIVWNEVDVCTHEFNGINEIFVNGYRFEYIGTLRPLFAQNIQKEVLAKFFRIGLTVAPPVSFEAKVQTYIGKNEIIDLPNSTVTVIMARGGTEKDAIIVFNSEFVRNIFDELKKIKDKKPELKNICNNIINSKEIIFDETTKGVTISYKKNGISIGSKTTNLNKSLNFIIDFSEI